MKLQEYCDVLGVQLNLTYYPNQKGRWTAQMEHSEVKTGNFLSSQYGEGKTPEEAMKDYARNIRGQHLVIGAYSDDRKEFIVPETLGVE
jgi:hypothetical protein